MTTRKYDFREECIDEMPQPRGPRTVLTDTVDGLTEFVRDLRRQLDAGLNRPPRDHGDSHSDVTQGERYPNGETASMHTDAHTDYGERY